MYNFFVNKDSKFENFYYISGDDYNHIVNVLRMEKGDRFLVSLDGKSDLCEIENYDNDRVKAIIVEENFHNTELPVKIYLFQGLPKNEKMEFIIQKTVELGVDTIVPVEMNRCVVKLDDKKKKSKQTRWQAIAESAAKQSKRNTIPQVYDVMKYNDAVKMAGELDLFLVPYENKDGMAATKTALEKLSTVKAVGILIGPEGGFDNGEIDFVTQNGGTAISLGKRILRTETAAITSVAMCMLNIELENKD